MTFGLALNAHHHRLARAVNVGVQQADFGALGRQRQREVDGRSAFANTALARGDGDDVFHAGQQLHAALHGVGNDFKGDVGRDVGHAGHALGGSHQTAAQRRNQALGRVAQLDVKRHIAAADVQVAQCARRDKIFARVRV